LPRSLGSTTRVTGAFAVEAHVRAVLVVAGGVLAHQVEEMTLTEHDHVIQQLSTKSGGRPRGLDLYAQNYPSPRRCQVITVAGFTIASTSAHRDQVRESTTQKARSMGPSRGRRPFRRSVASCWRNARFSAMRANPSSRSGTLVRCHAGLRPRKRRPKRVFGQDTQKSTILRRNRRTASIGLCFQGSGASSTSRPGERSERSARLRRRVRAGDAGQRRKASISGSNDW